jgi:hypothetical protein
MATLEQIRLGLATNLEAIGDMQQVSPYALPQPTPPSIEIIVGEILYHQAMVDGLVQVTMIVRAYVGLALNVPAQQRLDRFLAPSGDESVKAAIEADLTLGGVVDDVTVVSASGHIVFVRESQPAMLGAEWTVTVLD